MAQHEHEWEEENYDKPEPVLSALCPIFKWQKWETNLNSRNIKWGFHCTINFI